MTIRTIAVSSMLFCVMACGGKDGPTDPNGNGNGNGNNVRTLSATINGTAVTGTDVIGFYSGGIVSINATIGTRSLSISALNLSGPGSYSLNVGNQYSALAMIVDGSLGQFSTGFGGVGTLTLTVANIFRVAGTFSFTAYSSNGPGLGQPVFTVQNGVFDISITQ